MNALTIFTIAWAMLLVMFPWQTLVFTFGVSAIVGALMASGNGDGGWRR